MQADPILQPGWSQTLNRYSYVANNPLNATDPSGFCVDDCSDEPEDDPNLDYVYEGNGEYGFAAASPSGEVPHSDPWASLTLGPSPAGQHFSQYLAEGPVDKPSSGGVIDWFLSFFDSSKSKSDVPATAGPTSATPAPASGASPASPPPPGAPPSAAPPPPPQMSTQTRADAAKTQPVAPTHGGASEGEQGESAQSTLSPGAQALLASQPSLKSQFGQQLAVSNATNGELAKIYGAMAMAYWGGSSLALGSAAASGGGAALGQGSGLVHLTGAGNEIVQSGELVGPIYATSVQNAGSTGLSLTLKTGLPPSSATAAFPIPASAAGAFSPPVPVGPFTLWQYATGTQFTGAGTLNLATGLFTPTGANLGQAAMYAVDLTIDAFAAGAAYLSAGEP